MIRAHTATTGLVLGLLVVGIGLGPALGPTPARGQDAGGASQPAAKKDADDAIFRALQDELERAKTLKMKDLDRPYYLAGFVNDDTTYSCSASFGAITRKGGGRTASASVNVRVGTPKLDNTNFSSFGFSGGFGSATPSDPDYDALRQSLWLAFDSEYKSAAQAISKKRAYLASNTVKKRLPDFSASKVTTLVLPRKELKVDRDAWTQTVKDVSAVFRDYPFVQSSSASFHVNVAHQYFVSSDPARHRFPIETATFQISARSQCDDGMSVSANWSRLTKTPGDLPTRAELVKRAREVAGKLKALREAPTAEDYWGPVLFTGDAAAEFFVKTLADPLSDCRQELGSSSGGRLVDRMGRRIASRALTLRDDPTQTTWNGHPLLGYFPIDDDGVLPEPITLVDKGFLRNHFMSRIPTKFHKTTNGHSRAGSGSSGNLFVEASETVPLSTLQAKLLELAKVEDLDYGLVVEEMGGSGGGYSFSFGGSRGVSLPRPTYCYKLYADGRKQVIRGAAFLQSSYRVLRDIVAFGDDAAVTNLQQMGQLVSVVAPSVLIGELELRSPQQEFSKPPYSPRPDMK